MEYETRSEAIKVESHLKKMKKRILIQKWIEDQQRGVAQLPKIRPASGTEFSRILEKPENQRFSVFRDWLAC
jgi:ATP-dependent RNA circularization protein (DNA/RNA ligase family)